MSSSESILNFIRINENVGTGGQPTTDQLEAVRNEGYVAVVNLAPHDASSKALPGESELVRSLGMEYHHIPVAWTNPRRDQFEAFAGVMEELKGKKVLVHCAANFRVTAFYSLYAMKHEGWTVAQADQLIAKIWESRPNFQMDDTWRTFIDGVRSGLG